MPTLKALVNHYTRHYRPHAQRELEWFRCQPSFSSALRNAGLATDHRGNRYSHQARIPRAALEAARARLEPLGAALSGADSFDALHAQVEAAVEGLSGIGELYVYDTALRIGAFLNLTPQRVFLHRGTRLGAQALGLSPNAKAFDIAVFPEALRVLPPHEVEDILCLYKNQIRNESTGAA